MNEYWLEVELLGEPNKRKVINLVEHKILEERLGLSKTELIDRNNSQYSNIANSGNYVWSFKSFSSYKILKNIIDKYLGGIVKYNLRETSKEISQMFSGIMEWRAQHGD